MSVEIKPGVLCVAIKDYVPSTFDDLELRPGDTVLILEPDETEIAEEKIPHNYLKV